jgi:putative heme-binding domain-containing protein
MLFVSVLLLGAAALFGQTASGVAGDGAKLPPGDAAKGKALVEASRCLNCHRIGGKGSHLGPDLSDIGDRRTPARLQHSIMAPDEEVLPENRFVRVVSKDGKTTTGRLLNHDAFSVQLIDPNEDLRSFQSSSIREYAILDKGLMPSFQGELTEQNIADIVAYLSSLK